MWHTQNISLRVHRNHYATMECFLLENPPTALVTHLTKMQQVTSNPVNDLLSLTTSLTYPEKKK